MEANGHLVMLPRAEHGVPMNWSISVKRCASHGLVPFLPKTHHDLSWLFHLCESIWEEGIWIPAMYSSHLRKIQWLDGNGELYIPLTVDNSLIQFTPYYFTHLYWEQSPPSLFPKYTMKISDSQLWKVQLVER